MQINCSYNIIQYKSVKTHENKTKTNQPIPSSYIYITWPYMHDLKHTMYIHNVDITNNKYTYTCIIHVVKVSN